MGVTGHLRPISSGRLQELEQHPKWVYRAIYPAMAAPARLSSEKAAIARRVVLDGEADRLASEQNADIDVLRPELDLEERWQALRDLLAPSGEALSGAIQGGRPIGEDLGYGPARCWTASEVARLAGALSSLDEETLRERCLLATSGADSEPLLSLFRRLRRCYQAAAERGDAMLLWLD